MDPLRPTPAPDPHLEYLRGLLAGGRASGSGGEFLYVTRSERKAGFWELLGLRVKGHPGVLLGAVHFQAQSEDPIQFARRSLGHFLSAPPQTLAFDRESYPADLIELRIPHPEESVPDFLGRLRRGEPTPTLFLDAAHVEIGFDFRAANPSLQRAAGQQERRRRLYFRSREGHVLAGTALNVGAKLRRDAAFLALTDVRQHVPGRILELPTLVVHRSFLTMMAEPADAEVGPEDLPAPFAAEMANPFHLLDPRLTGAP